MQDESPDPLADEGAAAGPPRLALDAPAEGGGPAGTRGARRELDPGTRTALLFLLLFLAALVLVVGRAARDALFLTRFPVSWVAPLWIAYAAVAGLVAVGYARLADRLPRRGFALGFAAVGCVSYGALRVLIGLDVAWAYVVFYVWSEVVANLMAVVGWTLAQDLHDARSARRAFGWIATGRVVGMTVSGFLTGALAQAVGTLDLFYVLMAAFALFGALVWLLARGSRLPEPRAAGEGVIEARLRRLPVLRSRDVRTIALATLVLFAILTVGDYPWKAIARSALPDRDALAGFMGLFYGVLGAAAVVVQLVVAPRLLERFGVMAGMVLVPLVFTLASAAVGLYPSLGLAAVMKGSDNGLQFTVHEASLQMLLFPYPSEQRSRVRTLLAGIVKPLGYGLGGLALMLLAPGAEEAPGPELVAEVALLALVTVPLGLGVLGLMPAVRRGYLDAMRRSLMRHEVGDDGELDRTALAGLREALASDDALRVGFAAQKLRELDLPSLRAAVPRLARHAAPRVRALALGLARELDHEAAPELARAALTDPDVEVRRRAIEALATCRHEDVLGELEALAARDDDPALAETATAELLLHCGLDGMLLGAPRLAALLHSPVASQRISAAHVLGMVGKGSLVRSLAPLCDDPEREVRRAALAACVRVRPVRLLASMLRALGEPALRREAELALAALGSEAVPALERELADPDAAPGLRLAVPRVLGRIDHRSAFDALLRHVDVEDELVRGRVVAAASRARRALALPRVPLAPLRPRILRELECHERLCEEYLEVRPLVVRPLLEAHVLDRLRRALVRALRLCELGYPREAIASVRARLFDDEPSRRANAIELLTALLDRALGERFVRGAERLAELVAGRFPEPPLGPRAAYAVTFLSQEIEGGIPYRAALALEAAAHHALYDVGPYALEATFHPHPLVRENAVLALARLGPDGARDCLDTLSRDADPVVLAWARRALHNADAGPDVAPPTPPPVETPMFTTVEKVLFLQRVPVFSKVAGEDLVELARGAQVVDLGRGEVVFRQGAMGAALYFIISGAVALDVDGREIAVLGPNEPSASSRSSSGRRAA
ncbi:MAG: HEAT repeat domain-containing protein [Polyangiaceae bacterium]|nr:HEAT repeat domain-containing protein [Polyangiaceae bacterium]